MQPEVEWKGDFVGILNSFMLFEESMAETIKGIQHVSDEVSGRNLDFENVIILSMNDDNFPGNHMAQASFIPYTHQPFPPSITVRPA